MKRFFFILVLVSVGFTLGLSYRLIQKQVRLKNLQAHSPKAVYATHPILKNSPFVILVTAYNNEATAEKTLLSILDQKYENFRLIYIDDGSDDGSYEKVQAFLKNHHVGERAQLLRNEEHQGSIEALYRALHSCESREVALLLEGGEFLAHEEVLSRLNHYYANPDVWLTQGDALDYPTYKRGAESRRVRSFYTGLFQRIKLQEFLTDGAFLSGSSERILNGPLRELSGVHTFLTPDTFYISSVKRALAQGGESAAHLLCSF